MQSDFLKVENLTKKFGDFTAVDNVSFSLKKAEAFALLGESGCGKTTLLRCIAGLDSPNSGRIQLDQLVFFHDKSLIPVNHRNVGLVFQDYALFPHKSVDENITFGIKEKGLKAEKLNQMIKLFKLDDQRGKMPDQLSGGQLQRVAIARTLAASPAMILLDEPFSNLDKQLAIQLRDELKEIFRSQQLTSILVTHDQQEAFAHADTVAVMKEGKILQTGTPKSVYLRPESLEVAKFLGNYQFFPGTAHGDKVETAFGNLALSRPANGEVKVLIRPENISLTKNSAGNYFIKNEVFLGSSKEVTVTNGEIEVKAILPSFQNINKASKVSISVNSSVVAFP